MTFAWYKASGLCNQNHWKSWHILDNMPPKKLFSRSVRFKIWITLIWTSAIILKEWWYIYRCKIFKCKWGIWSYCSWEMGDMVWFSMRKPSTIQNSNIQDSNKTTQAYWAHFRKEKKNIFRDLTRNFREKTRKNRKIMRNIRE